MATYQIISNTFRIFLQVPASSLCHCTVISLVYGFNVETIFESFYIFITNKTHLFFAASGNGSLGLERRKIFIFENRWLTSHDVFLMMTQLLTVLPFNWHLSSESHLDKIGPFSVNFRPVFLIILTFHKAF